MNANEKAQKRSVSIFPTQWEHAKERADRQHKGNVSSYLQALIEADMQGAKATGVRPEKADPLEQLYGAFIPALRPLMAEWFDRNGLDQSLLISDLLAALADYAAGKPEHVSQPRRFYVRDEDPAQQLRSEAMERLDRWLSADAPGLNELEDASHSFQRNKRAGITDKERDAVQGWLAASGRNRRPKVTEVDAYLAEHHEDADRNLVHHLLLDHGIRPELDPQRKPRPEAQPQRTRKAR